MENLLEDLLKLKAISNGAAGSGWSRNAHEEAVESLIKKSKLRYVVHPNGGQNKPDFRVWDGRGSFYNLECKSSSRTNGRPPQLGDGQVDPNYIFIFTNIKGSTLIMGGDVVTPEMNARLGEYQRVFDAMQKQDVETFGKRIVQKRLALFTLFNWMLTKDRVQHEANVFNFVR